MSKQSAFSALSRGNKTPMEVDLKFHRKSNLDAFDFDDVLTALSSAEGLMTKVDRARLRDTKMKKKLEFKNSHLNKRCKKKSCKRKRLILDSQAWFGYRPISHEQNRNVFVAAFCSFINIVRSVYLWFLTHVKRYFLTKYVRPIFDYKRVENRTINDLIASRLEDFSCLVLGIQSSTNVTTFLLTVRSFYISLHGISITEKVMTFLNNCDFFCMFDNGVFKKKVGGISDTILESQADGAKFDYGSFFKDITDNYRMARNSPFFHKFSELISFAVAFSFLPDWHNNPLQFKGVTLFKASALGVHNTALSLTDMLVETAGLFMEKVLHAVYTRDPWSLLSYDSMAHECDVEYTLLKGFFPMIESGRLSEIPSENGPFTTVENYKCRLATLIVKYLDRVKKERNESIKNIYLCRICSLRTQQEKLIHLTLTEPIKMKPFSILVYGKSSVGKTSITNMLAKYILSANDYASGAENIVFVNEADKFDSEYTPDHNCMIFDDFGNTKAAFYTTPPTQKLIDIINNVPKAALKADLSQKGNIYIAPPLVVLTTNIKTLMSECFSNEPCSILRRFDLVLDVSLKKEYADASGGPDPIKMSCDGIPDAWSIDVQRVIIKRGQPDCPDQVKFQTVMAGAGIKDTLKHVVATSKDFYVSQRSYIANTKNLFNRVVSMDDLEEEEDDFKYASAVPPSLEISQIQIFEHNYACKFPNDGYGQVSVFGKYKRDEIFERVVNIREQISYSELCERYVSPLSLYSNLYAGIPIAFDFEQSLIGETIEDDDGKEKNAPESFIGVMRRNFLHANVKFINGQEDNLMNAYATVKNHKITMVLGAIGVPASLYAALQILKKVRTFEEQSISEGSRPIPSEAEPRSMWKKRIITPVLKDSRSCTTTYDQLKDLLRHKVVFSEVSYCDGSDMLMTTACSAFPLCQNYWIFPSHSIPQGNFSVRLTNRGPDEIGMNVTCNLDQTCVYRIEGDLAVLMIIEAGPQRDLLCFFPLKTTNNYPTRFDMIYRNNMGAALVLPAIHIRTGKVRTENNYFDGFYYKLEEPTARGMCVGPLLGVEKRACIYGFHLAGKTGQTLGACQSVDQETLLNAIKSLEENNVLQVHSSGDINFDRYDVGIKMSDAIHYKHCSNYLEDVDGITPSLILYGSHSVGSIKFRSNVRTSLLSDQVHAHLGIKREHYPPDTSRVWKHWQRDLQLMSCPSNNFNHAGLTLAYLNLSEKFVKVLKNNPCDISVLAKDYNLAGCDGIDSIDRMNMATSMGWPLNVKKSKYIKNSMYAVDGITSPLEMSDDIYSVIVHCENILLSGKMVHMVHRANLKDEPVHQDKSKIRVFSGCEIALTFLMRKYYLPIVRFIQNNWLACECAVGINAHGRQWNQLATHMLEHPNYIAGDYKAYDKQVGPKVMRYAFQVLIDVAINSGYTHEDVTIMSGLAAEVCFPLYEYDGVFIQLFGSNPSGHPLTVILNNLINSIYMRYVYSFNYDISTFSNNVNIVCYGDDNILSVSNKVPDFNFNTIRITLAESNIVYTTADKSDGEAPDYIPFNELSFLKRSFVFNSDFGTYMAPLDKLSFAKSLHNYTETGKSDKLPMDLCIENVKNILLEYFQWGEAEFERAQSNIINMLQEEHLSSQVITYAQCVDRYNGVTEATEHWDDILDDQSSLCMVTIIHRSDEKRLHKELEQKCIVKHKLTNKRFVLSWTDRINIQLTNFIRCEDSTRSKFPKKNSVADEIQQGVDSPILDSQSNETWSSHPLTTFSDGRLEPAEDRGDLSDITRYMGQTAEADLAKFLARPLRIARYNWGTATLPIAIGPWNLFFTNPVIANKIRNYYYLSCKLHIKVTINGSPMHMGRMLVSYKPLLDDPFEQESLIVGDYNTFAHSQRQHIWINPTTSQGGEMVLPFIYPYDGFPVIDGAWSNLGTLYLLPVGPLYSATSDILQPIDISIYAWAEELTLSVPTALTAQADEYGVGVVSRPASIVSKVAGALTRTPVIGKYALATQMAASSISDVATAFGYSKPVVVDTHKGMFISPASVGTNVNGQDGSVKLSLDCKQEVSIDPRITGVKAEDEMTIKHICGIESYISKYNWDTSHIPDTLLWKCPVTPMLYNFDGASKIYMTPMGSIASMFTYWRGTIRFRMQFCASAFHRGRVRIVYEPKDLGPASASNTNVNQQWIFDLSEGTDISFDISWAHFRPFLEVGTYNFPSPINAEPIADFDKFRNGIIGVYVSNALVSPDNEFGSTRPVSVIVSASACDDITFFKPTEANLNKVSFGPFAGPVLAPQSTQPVAELGGTAIEAEASQPVPLVGACDSLTSPLLHIYGGESIDSIRSLLKRFCVHSTINAANAQAAYTEVKDVNTVFPFYKGYSPTGNQYGAHSFNGTPLSYAGNTFLNYLTPHFICRRGSVRWKVYPRTIIMRSNDLYTASAVASFARANQGTEPKGWAATGKNPPGIMTFNAAATEVATRRNITGAAYSNIIGGHALEAEFPYQYGRRYTNARRHNYINDVGEEEDLRVFQVAIYNNAQSGSIFEYHVAAGDDYSLSCFAGVPTMYISVA